MGFVSRFLSECRYISTRIKDFPAKKVLVIEGGGMRGIFLVGVLQAFWERGYFPWKTIIGTSAGALTGTAYAAGQIHFARDAFLTELLSGQFIKMSNIFRPEKHVLNLDWLVDMFISGSEPLNIKRLRTVSCPVLIGVTRFFEDALPEPMYLSTKGDDIGLALKASAAIPFLYRNFVSYGGNSLMDGSVCAPIPYQKALEMGFEQKHILVLASRPKGYRKNRESFWVKMLYESFYKETRYQHLLSALDFHWGMYNKLLDELENNYSIDVIYPPEDFRVNRLTRSEEKIVEGFEQGITAAKNYLYQNRRSVPEQIEEI
jgi:predicted patatin/cPLA2 family phospholipase